MALVHLGRLLYNQAMPHATKSALQDAREAFIAGLARRADALRPVVESFLADPGAPVVRAELQRRLHSLLASAQLFEEPSLVAQLQRLTSRLDEVGLDAEAWQQSDSDLLVSLLASLDPQVSRAQVSGVAPAPASLPPREPPRSKPPERQIEPLLRSAQHVANEASVRPPSVAPRPANRPPAPVPTHQLGAVMLTRVLLVCSRPHAAELRSVLDEAPIELLHAADPEQALALLERARPSYALIAAEFATLPDIDLVARLRQDPHQPVDGVYLMLPHGATYDVEFVRQTGADGVLIEPISWEMLGPLLDRGGAMLDSDEHTEPDEKLSLEGGLSEAFAQAESAAAGAHRHVLESARVPRATPPAIPQSLPGAQTVPPAIAQSPSVLAQLQRVAAESGVASGTESGRAATEGGPSNGVARVAADSGAPEGALDAQAARPAAESGVWSGLAGAQAALVEPALPSKRPAHVAAEALAQGASLRLPGAAGGNQSVLAQVQAARAAAEAAARSSAASVLPQVQAARATIAELAALSGTSSVLAQVQAARTSLAEHLAPVASSSADKPLETGRVRPLIGRRVLIVDDDPAMLWFFSGVVRDAGGEALQARDGADGLDIARRKRPQLVLSDILMPKLDGFALRRALARDLYLERTPVLLLSWKGDPVEDAEARGTNASGMLRKEASVPDVLAAIERALAPRKQLEQALRAQDDVTGQVDDLGIVSLIECVVAARPDVRLTVEDAADLFEIGIAEANQISVTRTAADGTFTRGERALLQLIGVTHGRFHASKRSTSLRSPVQTPLKPALHAAVSELTALIDGVSSERLAQVARVTFDEDALASRLPDTPAIQPIVAELRAHGLSPTQLLAEGKFSSGELAACLMPLARQAVVTGLWGSDGKDLLADVTRLHMPRPTRPPVLSEPAATAIAPPPPTAAAPEPVVSAPAPVVETAPAEVAGAQPAAEPTPEARTEERVAPPAPITEQATVTAEDAPDIEQAAVGKPIEPESDFESDPEADFQLHTNPALIAEIAAARRRGREGVLLIATLAASCVLGYIGALQLETHPALFGRSTESIGSRGLVDEPLMAATANSETSVRSGLDPNTGLGTVLPYIDTTRGVPVGNDEGLVIFEYVGPLPTPNVEIDGRVLGSPPLSVALAANPHQLKLWFAGQPTTRTLSVRAGETRVITLPLSKP